MFILCSSQSVHFPIEKKVYQNVLLLQFCQTSMTSVDVTAKF